MEDGKKETFFGADRIELMAHTIGERASVKVSVLNMIIYVVT